MKTIKSIDLWTEQHANHYECFAGAFIDGFGGGSKQPYTKFKIIKNCNCIITNNCNLPIANKHNCIVFYQGEAPVRLLVATHETNIDDCVEKALSQTISEQTIAEIIDDGKITFEEFDLHEPAVDCHPLDETEIDTCSCDRIELLESMLKGSYTADATDLKSCDAHPQIYDGDVEVVYDLHTDSEHFYIEHNGAFYNTSKTSIIPIQKYGSITPNAIKSLLSAKADDRTK